MLSTALLVVQIALQAPGPPPALPGQFRPPAPKEWVAFSADMEFTYPGRPTQYGRHVQDEHGCRRQESAGPDGTVMVTILNFHTKTMYRLFRGAWSAQAMRVGEDRRVPPPRLVDRKVEPIEGFDAYLARSTIRSPKGDYISEAVLIPELNSFEARGTQPNGEVFAAHNIRVGPQDHDQFLPPAGAHVASAAGFGGSMTFSAVVLRLAFSGQPVRELTTMEENMYPIAAPDGRTLTLVAAVTDWDTNTVRIRVLENARGSRGNVTGDLLDEIHLPLGGTSATTKLPVNFDVTVTRVGNRWAR